MQFQEAILDYGGQPITKQMVLSVLQDYKRPFDKISELVKQGILTPVKSGIFVPGPKLLMAKPEPFLLANHLCGPSYVSMEAALAYWGLIPELVYEISSVTTRHNKTYATAAGRFSYTHLPLPYYAFGIQQVALSKKQTAMIASPEKALCDKIITSAGIQLRSIKQSREFLIDDLRIDEQMLHNLNNSEIATWIEAAPKKDSIAMLVKTLKTFR